MRILGRLLLVAVVLLAGVGLAYWLAGRATPPSVTFLGSPYIGQDSTLELVITPVADTLDRLDVSIEQGSRTVPLLTRSQPDAALAGALDPAPAPADDGPAEPVVRVTLPVGTRAIPDLMSGPALIVVDASRPVLRGLRRVATRAVREIDVRADPPQIHVVSTLHYIAQGGSEVVLYRLTPEDAASGVRVGERTYPGFPAIRPDGTADPELRLALFAWGPDQATDVPLSLSATDPAGNTSSVTFDHRILTRTFRRSRIAISDGFLARVVPGLLDLTPSLAAAVPDPTDDLQVFLEANGHLREENARTIASFAARTAPRPLWTGAFRQLSNSQVESAFADHRTYLYEGAEIDVQTHLGFDLASTARAPVEAANTGVVVHAGPLGIYGNAVIVDHGVGLQTLYAHLSRIDVDEGAPVRAGATLGLSGQTGLAGGDHLHFSVLVHGQFVNPTEWWDPGWIEDRIARKLRDAGLAVP